MPECNICGRDVDPHLSMKKVENGMLIHVHPACFIGTVQKVNPPSIVDLNPGN